MEQFTDRIDVTRTAQVWREAHQTIMVGHRLVGRWESYEVWFYLLHRNLNGLNLGLTVFWEDQGSCVYTHIHIHITYMQANLKITKTFLSLTWTTSIILHRCHYSFWLKTNPLMITLPSWAITVFLCCPLQQKSSNCLYKSRWWCFLPSLIATTLIKVTNGLHSVDSVVGFSIHHTWPMSNSFHFWVCSPGFQNSSTLSFPAPLLAEPS